MPPNFRSTISFSKRSFEGSAETKTRAEAAAAHNAVEFLAGNDRKKFLFFIAHTVSSGILREPNGGTTLPKISPLKLSELRKLTGITYLNELYPKMHHSQSGCTSIFSVNFDDK